MMKKIVKGMLGTVGALLLVAGISGVALVANAESGKEVMARYEKVEDTVVTGYKNIENFFVGKYQDIENFFVEGYMNIEDEAVEKFTEVTDKFVVAYLSGK